MLSRCSHAEAPPNQTLILGWYCMLAAHIVQALICLTISHSEFYRSDSL